MHNGFKLAISKDELEERKACITCFHIYKYRDVFCCNNQVFCVDLLGTCNKYRKGQKYELGVL